MSNLSTPHHVQLTSTEMMIASAVGTWRQVSNLRKGRESAHGYDESAPWQIHIEGALGECAVAKALDYFWPGSIDDLTTDVRGYQVRTTPGARNRLILHPEDSDQAIYILVTGHGGEYLIWGWIRGWQGKAPEYWDDPTGNRPAYFVPQEALRPLCELP